MMLGPDAMEAYHRRSDEAVTRIMKGKLPINWDLVDRDAEIQDIMLDAQFSIAQHFEDAKRRFAWFIHIANSHMAPATDTQGEEATWELSHRSLHMLVNGLLSDLKTAVQDDRAWKRLAKRHPGTDRHKLEFILERLG
jgi:hypothetical protein